jgi:hypothetical protein
MKTNPSLRLFSHLATFALAIIIASGLFVCSAQAAPLPYVVTLQQVGLNVVATGSGALSLIDTSLAGTGPGSIAGMTPATGEFVSGSFNNADFHQPLTLSGPANFGSGGATTATSGLGDLAGIFSDLNLIEVPAGYSSFALLSSSATYNNATFSSLGVTPGTYVWTWGTDPYQSFTLDIVAASVPEASTWMLLLLGLTATFTLKLFVRRSA